jgi:tripartite ATP-independent transporter DctP family solute receptor
MSTRRALLLASTAGLAGAALAPVAISATPLTFRWGHATQDDHPLAINAARVRDEVHARSGGRLEIALFGNNQLGGDTAMLGQVRSGALQIYSGYGGAYEVVAPLAGIEGIGFAFTSQAQALQTFDGPLGALVRNQIEELAGLITFRRAWVNGFRQITTSTKPIVSVGDLAGLKIRTPPSPIWVDLFKTLGAAPTPINASEMYTALQTHVVDAQENPFTIVDTYHLYEVQKYLSVTNHMWSNFWVVTNGDAFRALPLDLQRILSEAMDRAALRQRAEMERSNASLASKLLSLGMKINTVNTAPFRARLGTFYAKYREKYGDAAWSRLEAAVGKLG